ncbi:MAG TPA: alpha/beta hydrolase, partial [Actinomycetota bacterium]|nr:alpha/beta hydrolase [Actinomycetota bacterium]
MTGRGSARAMTHRWVDVGGLRLHCVEAGTGPLVVLLHGFPEFWYAWRHQLPALADAGYRVVAPDLPGYNTSDTPPRVRDYRPRLLAQKMADLIAALGAPSAAVAGHDWGGGLAWLLASHHPERVQRLVVLNAPHPLRFLTGLTSPRQLRRSWYILAFQLPWLPEHLVAASDFRGLRRALGRQPTRPGAFTAQDIDRYVAAAAQPGALGAAINYYRAAVRANPQAQVHSLRRVDAPTLVIWGDQDRYLGRNWPPRTRPGSRT